MKKGFTLVEMLVVIGILAILIGAGMMTFSSSTKKAQKAKGQELVSNVATAMTALYQNEGAWPTKIANCGTDGELKNDVAFVLAKKGVMSLSVSRDEDGNYKKKETVGIDRCGIVTPWAVAVLKRQSDASDSTPVPSGGTIADHRLHYVVDLDGDGKVEASVGGESLTIRASVAVWCCGPNGKMLPYSTGVKRDCIYSWGNGQIVK